MHASPSESSRAAEVPSEDILANMALVLAHRLRGLVAGIEGYTDLLADTLYTREQRDLALRILEGAARIESVLADLQRYGQPIEPVMLPLLVQDVTADLLAPLPEDARERTMLDVQEGASHMLLADPFLIRQALLVLVQNAVDATQHGGSVRVTVAADRTAPAVVFDVWNEGTIDMDAPEARVFEPFFTTKARNLGVGLTIARRIAELHRGSLDLTANDVEAGTCFSLRLPVAPDDV